MSQRSLFDIEPGYVINVSKVPHRSPFRYPGGKTWLVPWIRQWLDKIGSKPAEFIEPFAGGAIVGLTVAFENYADHVILVELDDQVAAVWKTILGENGEWLADKISSFVLTRESAEKILSEKSCSTKGKAFQTLLKNRIFHGGILANGSRMIRHGEKGKGIHSRWYPETLRRRILSIVSMRSRISFTQGDGIEEIRKNANRRDAVFFIDPPYTAGGKKAGRRLYTCSDLDHENLFRIAKKISGDFLMTYDDAPEVRQLAKRYDFDVRLVAMKNTHHAKMTELLIGKNLNWVD